MLRKSKSSRTKSYTITHKFIPRPGWQKDYDAALEIFLRILSKDRAATARNNFSKPSQTSIS